MLRFTWWYCIPKVQRSHQHGHQATCPYQDQAYTVFQDQVQDQFISHCSVQIMKPSPRM